jgi:hypothetical protein
MLNAIIYLQAAHFAQPKKYMSVEGKARTYPLTRLSLIDPFLLFFSSLFTLHHTLLLWHPRYPSLLVAALSLTL